MLGGIRLSDSWTDIAAGIKPPMLTTMPVTMTNRTFDFSDVSGKWDFTVTRNVEARIGRLTLDGALIDTAYLQGIGRLARGGKGVSGESIRSQDRIDTPVGQFLFTQSGILIAGQSGWFPSDQKSKVRFGYLTLDERKAWGITPENKQPMSGKAKVGIGVGIASVLLVIPKLFG